MSGHFVVGFLNRDVEKEYQKLDGSQRRLVRIAVAKLKTRADEIGTPLHGELAGCKKIKWRNAGLRMVFRIREEPQAARLLVGDERIVEIAEIVAIGRRDRSEVYKMAAGRLSKRPAMVEYDGTLR